MHHNDVQPRHRGPDLRDFVVVTSTTEKRIPIVHATRTLRVSVRTFVVVDSPQLASYLTASQDAIDHFETYMYYPDKKTGSRPWESRYVAAPFLAHDFYGSTYKWMLICDDDTLWFFSGLKRLLRRFDPSIPYYISDNVVDMLSQPSNFTRGARHFFMGGNSGVARNMVRPSWLGTTCLPCHAVQAERKLREKYAQTMLESQNWLGCPCINIQGCYYRRQMCAHQHIADPKFCNGRMAPPRDSLCRFSWPWGGTGMVTSVGLMQRHTWERSMRSFIRQQLSMPYYDHHAGDWILSLFLFDPPDKSQDPGYGITLPHYSALLKGEVLHLDHIVFGPVRPWAKQVVRDPSTLVLNNTCDKTCLWVLRHTVSHHASINGDYKGSVSATVAAIRAIAASHRVALQHLGEPLDHLSP